MESDEYRPAYSEETGLNVQQSALIMVFLTVFMDSLSSTISMPVLPYYALSFGVSTWAVGYLYASFNLAGFFGTPLLGRISDAYGRRAVLMLSLLGGGLAALGQAASPCFASLLAFRALSGIWGAVMPTAQVYLGDVCSCAVLADHMAKLSQVPSFSRTMGPGLGGGLSKLGLRVPLLVDGFVSLVTAVLVFVYVPESPAWRASQAAAAESCIEDDLGVVATASCGGKGKGKAKGKGDGGKKGASGSPRCARAVPVPWAAYGLGITRLFFAGQQSMQISMMAISMKAKFGWDALRVGYTAMSMAIVGLTTGIWISPRMSSAIGAQGTANAGGLLATLGLLGLGLSETPAWFLPSLAVSKVGFGLWSSTVGTMQVRISVPSNRGRVFSTIGMFQKVGSTIGPVIAGHVAARDPKRLIWFAAATWGLVAAAILFCIRVPSPAPEGASTRLLRGYSDLADSELEDEVGGAEDYANLGRHVGDLLSARHYRWVSHKEHVYEMMDLLLPEMSTDGVQHKEDLERMLQQAASTRRSFARARARPPRRSTTQQSWPAQL